MYIIMNLLFVLKKTLLSDFESKLDFRGIFVRICFRTVEEVMMLLISYYATLYKQIVCKI